MSARRNELVMAALLRSGKPVASDEVLDAMVGLGSAEGWSQAELASISRGSVAKRLGAMASDESGALARVAGQRFDETSRRMTPLYAPVGPYDSHAPVPPPPATSAADAVGSPYEGMSPAQVLSVLDAQDEMLECVARFLGDMRAVRERTRSRLMAAGVLR